MPLRRFRLGTAQRCRASSGASCYQKRRCQGYTASAQQHQSSRRSQVGTRCSRPRSSSLAGWRSDSGPTGTAVAQTHQAGRRSRSCNRHKQSLLRLPGRSQRRTGGSCLDPPMAALSRGCKAYDSERPWSRTSLLGSWYTARCFPAPSRCCTILRDTAGPPRRPPRSTSLACSQSKPSRRSGL